MNNFCNKSRTLIHKNHNLTPSLKYFSTNISQFSSNHQTLITNLINLIHTNNKNFSYSYQIIKLNQKSNNQYKIPSLPDILSYLFSHIYTLPITNYFPNQHDSKIIEQFLELSKISKEKAYDFLIENNNDKPIFQKLLGYILNANNKLIEKFPELGEHELIFNHFTSLEVLKDLDINFNDTGYLILISLKYNNNEYPNKIYLYTPNHLNKKEITKNCSDIIPRIIFFNSLLKTSYMPNKIFLFLSNLQKTIDDVVITSKHFRTVNVNSAVTNSRDIIIYRKEELLKSILHELIHFHNLDFRNIPTSLIHSLQSTHNINKNNKYLIYESITESMANFLNIIFTISNNSATNKLKIFNKCLYDELLFSIYQYTKILNILGYKTFNDFISNSRDMKKQFKQDSCVFSYYMLKCYILMNLDMYFNEIIDNDTLKFNGKKINKLNELYIMSRNNKHFHNIINQLLQNMNNNFKNNRKYKNITKKKLPNQNNSKINDLQLSNIDLNLTMRMTCLH